jgi:hypothetical protein
MFRRFLLAFPLPTCCSAFYLLALPPRFIFALAVTMICLTVFLPGYFFIPVLLHIKMSTPELLPAASPCVTFIDSLSCILEGVLYTTRRCLPYAEACYCDYTLEQYLFLVVVWCGFSGLRCSVYTFYMLCLLINRRNVSTSLRSISHSLWLPTRHHHALPSIFHILSYILENITIT